MKKLWIVLVLAFVFVPLIFSAGQTEGATTGAAEAEDVVAAKDDLSKEVDIKWTYGYWGTEMDPDNLFGQYLGEKFNCNIEMELVPQKTLNQKYSVIIASGNYPDILCAQFNNVNWQNWARQGAFVALNDYLESGNYPNLDREISYELYARSTMVDGKIYGVPANWKGFKRVVAYRKDWLENLGLEPPRTVEDFYDVARAFTFDDPDGNGKNDTYGFALQKELESTNSLLRSPFKFTMGGKAGDIALYPGEDGVELGFLRPGVKDYIAFLRKAWEEGIIEPSSPTLTQEDALWTSGKIGFFRMSATDWMNTIEELREVNPSADVGVCPEPLRAAGYGDPVIVKDKGWFRAEVITKAAEEPVEVKRILTIFDYLHGDGITLLARGIEGIHWEMKDGELVKLDAFSEHGWGNYNSMFKRLGKDYNLYLDDYEKVDAHGKMGLEMLDNYEKYAVDPVVLKEEPQAAENGNDMLRIRLEGLFEIITGARSLEDLEEIQNEWRKRGGDLYLEQAKPLIAK